MLESFSSVKIDKVTAGHNLQQGFIIYRVILLVGAHISRFAEMTWNDFNVLKMHYWAKTFAVQLNEQHIAENVIW